MTSSPHVLCLQCRVPGKTVYLYLGRGVTYQGFDLGTNKVPPSLRIQDKFLQFARHNWRGMLVVAATVSENDRVLTLQGKMGPFTQKAFFFWRGRDLFFANIRLDEHQAELFTSWEGKRSLDSELAKSIGPGDLFRELGFGGVEFGQQKSKDFNFEEYIGQFNSDDSESSKRTRDEKTLAKMKKELTRFNSLSLIERFVNIDLEKQRSVGEGRFKVSFVGLEGHFKKREFLFDKIKAWRKSKSRLEDRMSTIEAKISSKNGSKSELSKKFKIVQPIWKVEKKKSKIVTEQSHIEFSYGEWNCFLGRTAQENDFIRKEKAKKNDWWIHLEGMKSGHLIIKTNGSSLNYDDLQILGSALVELCGQAYADIPLIFTQVKNLKGVKGIAGTVTYKKEKHLKIIFDPAWRQKLTSIE